MEIAKPVSDEDIQKFIDEWNEEMMKDIASQNQLDKEEPANAD